MDLITKTIDLNNQKINFNGEKSTSSYYVAHNSPVFYFITKLLIILLFHFSPCALIKPLRASTGRCHHKHLRAIQISFKTKNKERNLIKLIKK